MFNFLFGSNLGRNSSIEFIEHICIPDNTKTKAKAKKNEREKKWVEVKEK